SREAYEASKEAYEARREAHNDYMIAGLKELRAKLERYAARRRATRNQPKSTSSDSSASIEDTPAIVEFAPAAVEISSIGAAPQLASTTDVPSILTTIIEGQPLRTSIAAATVPITKPSTPLGAADIEVTAAAKASPFTDPAAAAILPAQHNKEDDRMAQFQSRAVEKVQTTPRTNPIPIKGWKFKKRKKRKQRRKLLEGNTPSEKKKGLKKCGASADRREETEAKLEARADGESRRSRAEADAGGVFAAMARQEGASRAEALVTAARLCLDTAELQLARGTRRWESVSFATSGGGDPRRRAEESGSPDRLLGCTRESEETGKKVAAAADEEETPATPWASHRVELPVNEVKKEIGAGKLLLASLGKEATEKEGPTSETKREVGGGGILRANPKSTSIRTAQLGRAQFSKEGWVGFCHGPSAALRVGREKNLSGLALGLTDQQSGLQLGVKWAKAESDHGPNPKSDGIILWSNNKTSGGPDRVEKWGSPGLWQGPNVEEAVGFTISCLDELVLRDGFLNKNEPSGSLSYGIGRPTKAEMMKFEFINEAGTTKQMVFQIPAMEDMNFLRIHNRCYQPRIHIDQLTHHRHFSAVIQFPSTQRSSLVSSSTISSLSLSKPTFRFSRIPRINASVVDGKGAERQEEGFSNHGTEMDYLAPDGDVYLNTLRLVECSMFAAVTGLVYFLSNSLSIENYFGCFFSLPIVISSLRWGVTAGRKTMVATAMLLFVLSGPVKALTYLAAPNTSFEQACYCSAESMKEKFVVSDCYSSGNWRHGVCLYVLVLNTRKHTCSGDWRWPSAAAAVLINSGFFVFLLHLLYSVFLTRLGMRTLLRLPRWLDKAL
ncbi:unnamed protein product, partial [Linum tenue]